MSLRVGFLNMMPDAAVVVSERQFAALLGAQSGREVELVPFSIAAIARGAEVAAHMKQYYQDVTALKASRCEVLVITGANVSDPHLPTQEFWAALIAAMDWALLAKIPVLCSCLATHAVLEHRHGQLRQPVEPKVWGVFEHEHRAPGHPLLRGLKPLVAVPHSRHNEVTAGQFESAGYEVLLASVSGGVHLAVERQEGRWLCLQGHPEYEAISLLKEYKREVMRWQAGARQGYPPLPAGYLGRVAADQLRAYQKSCQCRDIDNFDFGVFPEPAVAKGISNTWSGDAEKVVANWLDSLA